MCLSVMANNYSKFDSQFGPGVRLMKFGKRLAAFDLADGPPPKLGSLGAIGASNDSVSELLFGERQVKCEERTRSCRNKYYTSKASHRKSSVYGWVSIGDNVDYCPTLSPKSGVSSYVPFRAEFSAFAFTQVEASPALE